MSTSGATRRDFLRAASFGTLAAGPLAAAAARRPNVVVIYIDDMGWADPACYGGKLVPTPNIDSIAANGVRFTNGYVAACVCGPSRVGLVTGRYQARTGHDANGGRPGMELDLREATIGQLMKRAGYATAITGKWHLGATEPKFLPQARGFDYSVGTVSNLGEGKFYRGAELLDDLPGAPVTTPYFTQEALGFIEKNRDRPFLLYVPYNAVHAPHSASEAWLEKLSKIEDRRARAYAAQMAELDEGIGRILAKLRELKLEENTLVFCIGDNGGPGAQSDNGGLRGGKWNLFEGGIRVPFLVQWKGRIRPGQVRHEPVIQLDVLPTALAAAGGGVRLDNPLDGVNLLPLLEGGTALPGRTLFWRFGVQWAVRRGDWKLIKASEAGQPMLFHLAADRGEAKDLAAAEPERAKTLLAAAQQWNAAMKPPRWEDRRWGGEEVRRQLKDAKNTKRGKKR